MAAKIRPKYRRFTIEEKRSVLAQWARTTQGDAEFAREQGVGKSSLFLWRRKAKGRAQKEASGAFVPLKVTPTAPDEFVEIRSQSGLVVRVHARSNEAAVVIALKAVLRCG